MQRFDKLEKFNIIMIMVFIGVAIYGNVTPHEPSLCYSGYFHECGKTQAVDYQGQRYFDITLNKVCYNEDCSDFEK